MSSQLSNEAGFLRRLQEVADDPHVLEVRGLGLMVGIELVRDRNTAEPYPAIEGMASRVVAEAMDRGAWVYPAGDGNASDALLLGPPFTISGSEMDEVARIVAESISVVCGT